MEMMMKQAADNIFYFIVGGLLIYVGVNCAGNAMEMFENLPQKLGLFLGNIFLYMCAVLMLTGLIAEATEKLPWVKMLDTKITSFFTNRISTVGVVAVVIRVAAGAYLFVSGILLWTTTNGIFPACPNGFAALNCSRIMDPIFFLFPVTLPRVAMFLWETGYVGGYESIGAVSTLLVFWGLMFVVSILVDYKKSTGFLMLFAFSIVGIAYYMAFSWFNMVDAIGGTLWFLAFAIISLLFWWDEKAKEIIRNI